MAWAAPIGSLTSIRRKRAHPERPLRLSPGQFQLVLKGKLKARARRIKRQCCTSACRACKEHGDSSVGIKETFQATRGTLQRGPAWPRFWPWIWFKSST